MKVTVYPGACRGEVTAPPSKSLAHRAIICAALADGVSHIENINYSQDILATINALRHLGAEIQCDKSSLLVKGGIS